MSKPLVIYWSRKDFRLTDNPGLHSAINFAKKNSAEFLPVFIIDEEFFNKPQWNFGYTFRHYLSFSLAEYATQFEKFCIFVGSPKDFFKKISKKQPVAVFAGNEVEPYCRKRDYLVGEILKSNNSSLHIYPDHTSVSLKTVSKSNTKYSVFTPFKNTVIDEFLANKPLPKSDISGLKYFDFSKLGLDIIDFEKKPKELQKKLFKHLDKPWILTYSNNQTIDLDRIFNRPNYQEFWYTKESEVLKSFDKYNQKDIKLYNNNRNFLGGDIERPLTSRMSVALAWGLVSSRTLADKIVSKNSPEDIGTSTFISELIWREFYRYVMYHNPHSMNLELQAKKRGIMWREGEQSHEFFLKWIKGETGYKIVDAAMNQIIQTGWMHNRARMIVASILTKNLGIDWRWGQDFFRAVLLDLDEASNNGGWQWGASVGSDPKPIRVFNPYSQQERFDPQEKYINHYLPKVYSITEPIIDHKIARVEALERYKLAKINQ